MPRGDKSSNTSKPQRKAPHIEEPVKPTGQTFTHPKPMGSGTVKQGGKQGGNGTRIVSGGGKTRIMASSRKGGRAAAKSRGGRES